MGIYNTTEQTNYRIITKADKKGTVLYFAQTKDIFWKTIDNYGVKESWFDFFANKMTDYSFLAFSSIKGAERAITMFLSQRKKKKKHKPETFYYKEE